MRPFVLLVLSPLLACDPTPSSPTASPTTAVPPTPTQAAAPAIPTVGPLEHLEADELTLEHRGRTVRVHGWVAPGSVAQRQAPPTTRFTLVRGEASLTVEHSGPLPDRFQEKLEAIVTGTLSDDGTMLRSDDLVARCPDDYETLPQWPEHGGPR